MRHHHSISRWAPAAVPAWLRHGFLVQGSYGVAYAALRHNVARAAFARAAAGSNTQFKLDVIKAHASVSVPANVAVRNTVADANDHFESTWGCKRYLGLNIK